MNHIQQLKTIFDRHENDRLHYPMNGFGRGWEMGEKVLNDCPPWFQKWYKDKNWHYVFLASGWNCFVCSARAFGMTEESLLRSLEHACSPTKYRCKICGSTTTNPRRVAEYGQSLRCLDCFCDGPVERLTANKL